MDGYTITIPETSSYKHAGENGEPGKPAVIGSDKYNNNCLERSERSEHDLACLRKAFTTF